MCLYLIILKTKENYEKSKLDFFKLHKCHYGDVLMAVSPSPIRIRISNVIRQGAAQIKTIHSKFGYPVYPDCGLI